jgi:hypothetical protein
VQQGVVAVDTGTLTQKYQARLVPGKEPAELISSEDTELIQKCLGGRVPNSFEILPTGNPEANSLIPITELFKKMSPLVGRLIVDPGIDQERNRGGELHREICLALGYKKTADDGQFPDVRHQLPSTRIIT